MNRPDHLTPLTDAEERLLRAILAGGKPWETDPRLWIARLLATLDEQRDVNDRLASLPEELDKGYISRSEAASVIRARLALDVEPLSGDALDGLPAATCYRTHIERDEHLGVVGAVWKADVRRQFAADHLLATIPDLFSESGKGETE